VQGSQRLHAATADGADRELPSDERVQVDPARDEVAPVLVGRKRVERVADLASISVSALPAGLSSCFLRTTCFAIASICARLRRLANDGIPPSGVS
jgi:hypothetical protein